MIPINKSFGRSDMASPTWRSMFDVDKVNNCAVPEQAGWMACHTYEYRTDT